ncbi:hypothetical protein CCMSSC00406_0006200 [Pleurotus cornucopiae]|uniref:Uncharacterized protein n=1 Tax=Pleurotus cornucopiae TaxID=5321 RepID=A0ACB7J496_PLECO|nr:hypothetical protein CCMSSC00406_0006200 [Pleurotus cornucopiae]
MAHNLQHVPAYSTDDLCTMKKKEAVVAYETEVQYFAGMEDTMPELDDAHREDMELAIADMEQQQDWLSAAEEILLVRELQVSVEDKDAADAERRRAEDEQQREAKVMEEQRRQEAWQAAEVREARHRDVQAAEERQQAAQRVKLIAGSGTVGSMSGSAVVEQGGKESLEEVINITSGPEDKETPVPHTQRRASAIQAGKRKVVESNPGEPETTPRAKRLRKRAVNTDNADNKTTPPPAPLDIMEYREYNPADASSSPNNVDWGCGYGALKKSCSHPHVKFLAERRCLRCQQGYCKGNLKMADSAGLAEGESKDNE